MRPLPGILLALVTQQPLTHLEGRWIADMILGQSSPFGIGDAGVRQPCRQMARQSRDSHE